MLTLSEWVRERLANCERIAAKRTGAERAGWLEDARYFRMVLDVLERDFRGRIEPGLEES